MTLIRITHRTIIEPIKKYPIESIVVHPGCMILNFRKKQYALDMFKKIKLASKNGFGFNNRTIRGGPRKFGGIPNGKISPNVEIYVDPIYFFKRATGTVKVATFYLEIVAHLLQDSMSRRSYRNLLDAFEMRSYCRPARWEYDSKKDFERQKDNVITHYFKKHHP
jgi:hypothetical protein